MACRVSRRESFRKDTKGGKYMVRVTGQQCRVWSFTGIAVFTVAGGVLLGNTVHADDFTGEVRAIGGGNNNVAHPEWGTPGTHLLREASGTHYADGISAMARPNGPSARAVSNAVFVQQRSVPSH